jgi:hypothetical protein
VVGELAGLADGPEGDNLLCPIWHGLDGLIEIQHQLDQQVALLVVHGGQAGPVVVAVRAGQKETVLGAVLPYHHIAQIDEECVLPGGDICGWVFEVGLAISGDASWLHGIIAKFW